MLQIERSVQRMTHFANTIIADTRDSPTAVTVNVAHHGNPVSLCRPSIASTAALVVGHKLSGKQTA